MQCEDENIAISLEDIPFSSQIEKKMQSPTLNLNDERMEENDEKLNNVNDKSNEDEYLLNVFDEMVEEDQENLNNVNDKNNDPGGREDEDVDYSLAITDEVPEGGEELSMDMTTIFTIDEAFDSHFAVTKHLKALGRDHGIVIVKKRSNMKGNRSHFIEYQCERSDIPRDHVKGGKYEKKIGGIGKKKPRKSSTRKCGCPFALKTIKDKLREVWTVRVLNGVHNHKSFKYDEGHTFLGKVEKEDVEFIVTMTRNGIRPKNILKMLRSKDPKNCTTLKAIYNIRARVMKEIREGRSVMQEVYKLAESNSCFVECRFDADNVVRDIFWCYKESLSLLKCFPSVMLMDCTYKTNKYKMPLLQIVGVTSTDMSFSAGFALLSFEKEDNYTWALKMFSKAIGDQSERVGCIVTDREEALMNAVRGVFPKARNLICLWHIEKGLVSNLKTRSNSNEWQDLLNGWSEVVKSNSEEEMNDRLDAFNKKFGKVAMHYVSTTWLNCHKKAFVSAWTNSVFHLGNTSTSRAEGMHAVFKNWLKSGLGDVVAGWEAGLSMIDQEIKNIKKSFEKSLFMEPKKFKDNPMFKELKFHVSIFALELLYAELEKTDDSDALNNDCRCTIRATHGLPCRHQLARFKKNPRCIPLSSIDIHWRTLDISGPPPKEADLDYVPVLNALEEKFKMANGWERERLISKLREICQPSNTVLQEPITKKTGRGRPKGAGNKRKKQDDSSTKREKSKFEHVEEALSSVNELKVFEGVASAPTPPTPQSVVSASKKRNASTGVSSKGKKPKAPKFVPTTAYTVTYLERYLPHFPPNLHEHILSIINVEGDGNCGFRVVAHGIGLFDSDWPMVRKALQYELETKKEHYLTLFGAEGYMYNRCLECLDHEVGPCLTNKYFESYLGWVVCNVYGVSVSIVSTTHGNQTFLPTLKKPSSLPVNHIWMGFCNGNHFMRLFMKDECPMPRVSGIWHNNRISEAAAWYELYEHRIALWKDVIPDHWVDTGKDVKNAIDVDNLPKKA